MPFYHKLGQLPHKRHTQFRKPNGELYREELMDWKDSHPFNQFCITTSSRHA